MAAPISRQSAIAYGEVHIIVHDQDGSDGAGQGGHRTDRQIDIAGDDHQQHPQRQDHNIAVLQHQVGQS
jgi:hypothetical protein